MDALLAGLRAAGEATRLRLLHALGQSDLTVSELTQILGQSQPRISRHLKLMVEAGLLERHPYSVRPPSIGCTWVTPAVPPPIVPIPTCIPIPQFPTRMLLPGGGLCGGDGPAGGAVLARLL